MRATPIWIAAFASACASAESSEPSLEAPTAAASQAAAAEADVAAIEPSPSVAACDTPEHRQFDFWLGEWEVKRADGTVAGHNRIERILDGCALQESYDTDPRAYRGFSFNTYDAGRKQWHQTWVDNGGLLLKLDGGLDGKRMVLRGGVVTPEGEVMNEIAWTPLEDGRVKQHWRTSKDGGQTWADAFVGFYERVK